MKTAIISSSFAFTNTPPAGSVFIATSRDGFIADRNGSVDWLNELQTTHPLPPNDDGGFTEFMASIDAIIMGRKTYDTVVNFLNMGVIQDWPYGEKPTFVFTGDPENVKIPSSISDTVEIIPTSDPNTSLDIVFSKTNARDVYIDGGKTISAFMGANLVRRVIITVVPVSLGEGISLFTKQQRDRLEKISSRELKNGFIQEEFRVVSQQMN